MKLQTTKKITIRFSEIDAMNVVWHGSYMLYFEDAREAFGKQWGLGYDDFFNNHVFAPVVDMNFQFRNSIRYNESPSIEITYVPSEAAKIIFDYRIYNPDTSLVYATGRSTQVFMNTSYELIWDNPEFYIEWKKKWGQQ